MTEKIDTQGMSGESVKGCTDNVYPHDSDGNPIYPAMIPRHIKIIDGQLREELIELLNEVLDEREYQKRLKGPYDVYRLDELQE
jgi:hypothetical protein